METLLVRLKPYDLRRGHVLRRYTYLGIKFQDTQGWFRVPKPVADYLKAVHQVYANPHTPLAFDVATEKEAVTLDDVADETAPRKATDPIQVSVPIDNSPTEAKPEAKPAANGRPKSRPTRS